MPCLAGRQDDAGLHLRAEDPYALTRWLAVPLLNVIQQVGSAAGVAIIPVILTNRQDDSPAPQAFRPIAEA